MNRKKFNNVLEEIDELLKAEKAEQAKKQLEKLEEQDSVHFLLLKGKVEQKYQNWGEAINAFNRVLDIDPQNAEAENSLKLIKNILNFWNPDLLNP